MTRIVTYRNARDESIANVGLAHRQFAFEDLSRLLFPMDNQSEMFEFPPGNDSKYLTVMIILLSRILSSQRIPSFLSTCSDWSSEQINLFSFVKALD